MAQPLGEPPTELEVVLAAGVGGTARYIRLTFCSSCLVSTAIVIAPRLPDHLERRQDLHLAHDVTGLVHLNPACAAWPDRPLPNGVAGRFVFGPMGIPHAFVVTSERSEFLITFSRGGTKGPSGYGVHGFFREVAVPVVAGHEPPVPTEPDPEDFARRMLQYGIELVGPPPTLD